MENPISDTNDNRIIEVKEIGALDMELLDNLDMAILGYLLIYKIHKPSRFLGKSYPQQSVNCKRCIPKNRYIYYYYY